MPSSCVICGQRLAPRQWWNPVSPVVHDTPSGECPTLLAKQEELRRLEARPDAATLREQIARVFGHDVRCSVPDGPCDCGSVAQADRVMAVLAEHGLVEWEEQNDA